MSISELYNQYSSQVILSAENVDYDDHYDGHSDAPGTNDHTDNHNDYTEVL